MKAPKVPPGLKYQVAQFLLFLVVLGCILIESPDITWREVIVRIALMAGAGYGVIKLEGKVEK